MTAAERPAEGRAGAPAHPPSSAPSALRGARIAAGLAAWTVAAGLTALAALTVATALLAIVRTHGVLPQADEWFSLDLYDHVLRALGDGRAGEALRLVFKPHNEHRIFFPRLVFFADYGFFHGSGRLDKAVILATQALEAALFAWLICLTHAGAAARTALCAVAVALLFSLQQAENFVWSFQVQFVGVFACASLCCTCFAFGLVGGNPSRRSSRASVAGAYGLVMATTFTMANGLLVGPVLVALAAVAHARRAMVLATAAVAVAAAALFFTDYHPATDGGGPDGLLAHLPRALAFAAGYLGTFSRFGQASEVALGALGLAATAAIALVLAIEGRPRHGARGDGFVARLALLGIALFAAGSALATGVGRSGWGMQGIEASRYATGAACFWAATLPNLWSLAGRRATGRLGRLAAGSVAGLAAAVLLESSAVGQADRGAEVDQRAAKYDAMGDAMLLGLQDVPALEAFEEPVELSREMEGVLRRRHLSIFATRDAGLVGRPLSEAAASDAPPLACAGGFSAAVAVPSLGEDGVAVSGTSSLRSRRGGSGRVYVVDGDGDGRIAGFAHTGFGDPRWSGYARARPGAALTAWGVSDAGRPCRLGTVVVSAAAESSGG